MTMKSASVVGIAVILGALRVLGVKHPAFQAAAHLYVGGLFTAYAFSRRPLHLLTALAITAVEVAAASAPFVARWLNP